MKDIGSYHHESVKSQFFDIRDKSCDVPLGDITGAKVYAMKPSASRFNRLNDMILFDSNTFNQISNRADIRGVLNLNTSLNNTSSSTNIRPTAKSNSTDFKHHTKNAVFLKNLRIKHNRSLSLQKQQITLKMHQANQFNTNQTNVNNKDMPNGLVLTPYLHDTCINDLMQINEDAPNMAIHIRKHSRDLSRVEPHNIELQLTNICHSRNRFAGLSHTIRQIQNEKDKFIVNIDNCHDTKRGGLFRRMTKPLIVKYSGKPRINQSNELKDGKSRISWRITDTKLEHTSNNKSHRSSIQMSEQIAKDIQRNSAHPLLKSPLNSSKRSNTRRYMAKSIHAHASYEPRSIKISDFGQTKAGTRPYLNVSCQTRGIYDAINADTRNIESEIMDDFKHMDS